MCNSLRMKKFNSFGVDFVLNIINQEKIFLLLKVNEK